MQKQYKLYRIDENAIDDVKPLLSDYLYEEINQYIIAVEYDYLNNGYKELLERMSELPTTQYIITASVFYRLLLHFVKNGINVYEVKLNVLFEEDNVYLGKYIRAINQNKDDDGALGALINVLKWYNYDEGIDISHMTFGMKMDNRNCRFYCYNNGVLAIDSEKIIIPVFELLRRIL